MLSYVNAALRGGFSRLVYMKLTMLKMRIGEEISDTKMISLSTQDEKHFEKPDFVDPLDSIKMFEEDESFQDVKVRLYQALMDNQRTTFEEFYVKGESIKQINEKFGIPVGTIKSTLMRIRNRLKAMGIDEEQH